MTGSGTTLYSTAAFLQDISAAAALLEVEGVALAPTYIAAKTAVVRGYLEQVSTTGQPIFGFHPDAEVHPEKTRIPVTTFRVRSSTRTTRSLALAGRLRCLWATRKRASWYMSPSQSLTFGRRGRALRHSLPR